MPKAVLVLFAAVAVAVSAAACGGSSSPTPTPQPSVSFTPNPTIHKATVEVTILGTPAPKIPVAISTPKKDGSVGTPFATQKTGSKGMTTFKGLNPNKSYCFLADLGGGKTSSQCGDWTIWQFTTIPLGT